ncbi:MAG TPA: hypothetical protein VHL34_19935, partial [Rhizomicrobium sp.]|nr:hypothetical protein [Rhizomicrobium sp.]
ETPATPTSTKGARFEGNVQSLCTRAVLGKHCRVVGKGCLNALIQIGCDEMQKCAKGELGNA